MAKIKKPKNPITLFEEITPSFSESIDMKNCLTLFILIYFYTHKYRKGTLTCPLFNIFLFISYPSQDKQSASVLEPKSPLITESVLR